MAQGISGWGNRAGGRMGRPRQPERGRGLPDRADQTATSALGSAENCGKFTSARWAGAEREQFQAGAGALWFDAKSERDGVPGRPDGLPAGARRAHLMRCGRWTLKAGGTMREGRCEPLTVRDEYSRYVLELRALPNARTATVRAVLSDFLSARIARSHPQRQGAPFASPTRCWGSRNSACGGWPWALIWNAVARGVRRTTVATSACIETSPENSKASDYEQRQAAFETWRREFNEERPHQALGMRVPAELYHPSVRKWNGTSEQISYPGMATRRVKKAGAICYEDQRIFISQALAGWDVGLRYRTEEVIELYFAQLLLGVLETPSAAFIPITETQPTTKSMLREQHKELAILAAA